jgi:purine-binding chemotaxis protein CheW
MRSAVRSGERGRAEEKEIVQLASFLVGDGWYALDIMRIKEIIQPQPITRVPKAPPFIEGVIELRGAILPIVDLRKRFDLEPTPPGRSTKYLIVALEGLDPRGQPNRTPTRWVVGLVVDGVREVLRVARDEIRPAPAMAVGESSRYFSGVCPHRDQIVMVLDLDAVLSSTERISLAGLAQESVAPRPGGKAG